MHRKRWLPVRMFLPAALAVGLGLAGLNFADAGGPTSLAAAAQDLPPCTAEQMAGTRQGNPLVILDATEEGFPDLNNDSLATLVAGGRYAVVVDTSRATREATPTDGSSVPVQGSVQITAPAGVGLTRTGDKYTEAYSFTAPAPGPLRFQATWQQEVSGPPRSSDPTVTCSAAAALDVLAVARKPVLTSARFHADHGIGGAWFEALVVNQTPPDQGRVTAVLRVRPGVASAPAATGRATKSLTFNSVDLGVCCPLATYVRAPLRLRFEVDSAAGGARVVVTPGIDGLTFPVGRQLRFGFSLELRQAGHRVGGMRSGAVCTRIQISNRRQGRHTEMRCDHPGFAARP
jgi:hypothetical protein